VLVSCKVEEPVTDPALTVPLTLVSVHLIEETVATVGVTTWSCDILFQTGIPRQHCQSTVRFGIRRAGECSELLTAPSSGTIRT
jgi:hypothetical protein